MSTTGHAPRTSPRWPVLATLVAAVLGLHLVLLGGGVRLNLPSFAPSAPAVSAQDPTAGTDAPATDSAATASDRPAVRVSTVRWIVPAPVPTTFTKTTVTTPAPRPRAAPRPAPAPAARVEVPMVEPSPPAPEVAATVEARVSHSDTATEPVADSAATSPAPAESEARAETVEAVEAVEVIDPVAADEGDVLLAATTPAKPRSTATRLPPVTLPPSTRLDYDVTGNVKGIGYRAQGTLDWALADGRYSARMEMRVLMLGSRSQTSTGRVGPAGLMPERFADKSRSEKAAHFDAAQQRIRFSNNAPEAALMPGAQDRLSLFLQLAGLLQARPQAYATGQIVEMQVAGTGDAPVWRFQVGEESTVSMPAGDFKVRHLVRQPRKEFDSTVEMWLAPSLGHLPVRLRVTQSNGDVADQRLSRMP